MVEPSLDQHIKSLFEQTTKRLSEKEGEFHNELDAMKRSLEGLEYEQKKKLQAALDDIEQSSRKIADEQIETIRTNVEQKIELIKNKAILVASAAFLAVSAAVAVVAYNSLKDVLSLQSQVTKDMLSLQNQLLAAQEKIQSTRQALEAETNRAAKAAESTVASKGLAEAALANIGAIGERQQQLLLEVANAKNNVVQAQTDAKKRS